MKLIPVAKPVKIRLVDNRGFEYDSFGTLKNHFDIGELEKTENLEYTLPKWLRQKGLGDIADKVAESLKGGKKITEASEQEVLDFYLLFFKPDMEMKETYDLIDLVKHWINCKAQETIRCYLNLGKEIHSDNLQAFRLAYHACPDIDTNVRDKYEIWNKLSQNCDDPEVLFEAGRLWFEVDHEDEDNTREEALEKIRLAADKGWSDAIEFLEEYKKKEKERIRPKVLKEWKTAFWNNWYDIPSTSDFSAKEKEIEDFVRKCKQIDSRRDILDKLSEAESLFGNVKESEILATEKKFVLAAAYMRKYVEYYSTEAGNEAKTILHKIHDYGPALALIRNDWATNEEKMMKASEKYAYIKDFPKKSLRAQMDYVIDLLLDNNNEE